MDDSRLASLTFEETEQELKSLLDPDFHGVRRGSEYEAARLFARMNELFRVASQVKAKPGGFSTFNDWIEDFGSDTNFKRRSVFYYVKVGRFLVPHGVTEVDLGKLGMKKAVILAKVAEAGRLTSDLLEASSSLTAEGLEERAALLLGTAGPWTENLRVDSHEAAVAALLALGNWLGFKTYTDHAADSYAGQKLGEIATLRELPRFTTDKIMESVCRIDVVWVGEETDFPQCFFEVEHSTDITKGLLRMFQAISFDAQFFIVAREESRQRFDREIEKAPHRRYREKYRFRAYSELETLFKRGKAYFEAYKAFFG